MNLIYKIYRFEISIILNIFWLLNYIHYHISCSFYTFSKMPEVKEIIVVCDPSYRDIFEGLNILSMLPLYGQRPGNGLVAISSIR